MNLYSTRAREIFVGYLPPKPKLNDVMLPCLPLVSIYLHSPGHQVSMYPPATCQTLWNKQHKRISLKVNLYQTLSRMRK